MLVLMFAPYLLWTQVNGLRYVMSAGFLLNKVLFLGFCDNTNQRNYGDSGTKSYCWQLIGNMVFKTKLRISDLHVPK